MFEIFDFSLWMWLPSTTSWNEYIFFFEPTLTSWLILIWLTIASYTLTHTVPPSEDDNDEKTKKKKEALIRFFYISTSIIVGIFAIKYGIELYNELIFRIENYDDSIYNVPKNVSWAEFDLNNIDWDHLELYNISQLEQIMYAFDAGDIPWDDHNYQRVVAKCISVRFPIK